VELRGAADQFTALSRRLKQAANKDLNRELTRALNRSVLPLKRALPESARATLPRRGGLADRVAASKIGLRRSDNAKGNGIRLVARNQYQLGQMDRGIVRHPVFKRKGEERRRTVWMAQRITPGWFSGPAEELAPLARRECAAALDRIKAQLDASL
jgi:hypothetical protein